MPPLPDRTTATLKAIHAARLEQAERDGESPFIRASQAYSECSRSVWYDFRWASPPEQFSARMLRLFETGNIEEERFLDDLRAIGVDIVPHKGGEQFQINIGGFIRGHLDGIAKGLPEAPKTEHLIECKSANDKSFASIVKKGVEKGKPGHWLQMQLYMLGAGLKRALYMLVNKNTDEEHIERVRFNEQEALRAVAHLEGVATAPRPPGKLHDDPDKPTAFACKWCRHKPVCHDGSFPRAHCRTCLHATPLTAERWHCARWDRELSVKEQRQGCGAHLFVPDLVPGAQEDADPEAGTVTYRMADGSEWVDGEGSRCSL